MENVNLKTSKRKKMLIQSIIGFVCGILSYVAARYLVIGNFDIAIDLSTDAFVFMAISVMYFMIGLSVFIGVMLPRKIGAVMLNVQDEEEIEDEKQNLWISSVILMAIGASQILLLMSLNNDYITPVIGFAAMTATYIISLIISFKQWDHYDELVKKVTFDSSYLCLSIICTILWFWCSAAWLNWMTGPTPLSLLSMISGIYLLSLFIVATRLGLTETR